MKLIKTTGSNGTYVSLMLMRKTKNVYVGIHIPDSTWFRKVRLFIFNMSFYAPKTVVRFLGASVVIELRSNTGTPVRRRSSPALRNAKRR